jgi:hypothetical protein
MRHPAETQLALFAGGDLSLWERWRVGRHVSQCTTCEHNVQALRTLSGQLRDSVLEAPRDLNWTRLAQEMAGNIHVGLAAGDAIARFDKPAASKSLRLGWNASLLVAAATVVFGIAFWSSLPPQQAEHLLASLKRIRTERIGALVHGAALGPEEVVLEASSSGIGVKENGGAMSLMHPHSDGGTVSVSLRGSAGVRFVDADTGQVTTNKVYYAEQ